MLDIFSKGGTKQVFKARSAERDAETDRLRIAAITGAIDRALSDAQTERDGLSQRMDDIISRAAVTFGNGSDEYLTREALDTHHLDLFDDEIRNGQRRIAELDRIINDLKSLNDAIFSKFPGAALAKTYGDE